MICLEAMLKSTFAGFKCIHSQTLHWNVTSVLNFLRNQKTKSISPLLRWTKLIQSSLLDTLADILLIWKCNLPKDITGMEINTAITGWERGLMRIWQDVRLEIDLQRLESLSKETQLSSKWISHLWYIVRTHYDFRKGRHLENDMIHTCSVQGDHCHIQNTSAQKVYTGKKDQKDCRECRTLHSFSFGGLGCLRDSFKASFCK